LADLNLDNTSIGLLIAPLTLRLTALPFPGDQVNAVLLVPAGRLNDDFGKRPLARAITTPSAPKPAPSKIRIPAIAYLWQTGQGKPGATIFVNRQSNHPSYDTI
jgi:hypothetical protein